MSKKGQGVKAVVAIVMLLVAGAVAYFNLGRTGDAPEPDFAQQRYVLDLSSGELRAVDPAVEPPTPQQPVAAVFSCGDCGDEQSLFVGYVERGNPQFMPGTDAAPMLIGLPGDDMQWVEATPREKARVKQIIAERCAGADVQPCSAP